MTAYKMDKARLPFMRKLSAKTLRTIGWAVIIGGFVLGIVLGEIFKTPDNNLEGQAVKVFDIGLAFCTWLIGGVVGAMVLGKAAGR
jgi:hypothetical protein